MIRGMLLVLLAWPALLQAQAAPDRPNILILMAEDLSSRIGAFGDPVARTPNIDRLAASGVRFPNTFTTAGVCAPSRAAHITGMHQASIGAQHMRSSSRPEGGYLAVPPPQVKAYPELLRRAGYYTLTNGKLDYQFSTYGAGSGPFTIWDYEGSEPDWNRRADGQAFFALINFGMTHESRMFQQNVEKQQAQGWRQVTDPASVTVPPYYPDTPVIRRDIAQLYDNIHEMDRQVGQWLARLESDGLVDDTIVIWTTDHGDGLPRAKREIYDSGIRVPLVVHWPERWRPLRAEPGGRDERLLSFIDFAPSALRWAGVEAPDWMQGVPVLADPAARREFVFASKDRLDEMLFHERAVRDARFKYIVNYRPGEPGGKTLRYREQLATMQELHAWHDSGRMSAQQAFWFEPRPLEEFYDLALDPHEVNNLAADPAYAAELERLRNALADWQDRVPDLSSEPEAAMAERFWPDGEQPVTGAPALTVEEGWIRIASTTPGASIGYRIGGEGRWLLYTGPFEAPEGESVEAKAVRYGWRESAVTVQ
jgi:arylsulfatase A-like enzyme